MSGPDNSTEDGKRSRIQARNRAVILDAGLDVFSTEGFKGATLDRIASAAGLSKPNVLYYFGSKEAIYAALIDRLLATWLDPLEALDHDGEPVAEILSYVRRKLDLARDFPRESRLFANEIIQGAPRIGEILGTDLKTQVDRKAAVIRHWVDAGRLRPVDPHHLIISVWALTQHYADFAVQLEAVLGGTEDERFADAAEHLERVFSRLLQP